MIDSTLDAALRRGAFVVTPNKRLARDLADAYDAARLDEGCAAWPAARSMPWATFVGELVQRAHDAQLPLSAQRLDATQSLHLWRRIVAADAGRSPLVDIDAAAMLAADAWQQLHAYGTGAESWRGFAYAGPDVDAFTRWAESYAKELRRTDALDAARAADAIAALAPRLPAVQTLDVMLVGFLEPTPQQQRLVAALTAAGATCRRQEGGNDGIEASQARLATCETPRDELAQALDWARECVLAREDARVGIVVLDLAQRREAVRAACEDRLCAPLQWPGSEEAPRPYEISLGVALADVPLIASALTLIALGHRPLERARVVALVRSPYLPDSERDWMRRAALERSWLERGVRELGWPLLVQEIARVDQHLHARWQWATGELPRVSRLAPRAWVERWRGWLTDAGWCDGRALSSEEFQADGAWNELLGAFARLAAVAPSLSADEALATLERLAREQVFQPAGSAPIRVLGALEAAGLAFDALWVAGMAADAWPRPPDPHPMLPIAWQRERDVPRSSSASELRFARELTRSLAHAAPVVVFSFAAAADDHRRTPSPLVAGLPPWPGMPIRSSTAARMFESRPALDAIVDLTAPVLAPGERLPGGTGLIEAQSACGFRAVAVHRLGAQPWPPETLGLTPIERGNLVHATLDRFWRATQTHAALVAMDDDAVDHAIARAFDEARGVVQPARWATLPPAVAASEGECVARLVRKWLVDVERVRPPFTVVDTERRTTVDIAGHMLALRIDRVDRIDGQGLAVIDYKTGFAMPPPAWFETRPQALQLALYARAAAVGMPETDVKALVYAQLRRGDVKAVGLAADGAAWPGLTAPDAVRDAGLADWDEANERLQRQVETLVRAFAAGEASIAPRDAAKVCAVCGLQAVCRIASAADEATSTSAEAIDDD